MTLTEQLLHKHIKASKDTIEKCVLEYDAIHARISEEKAIIKEAYAILQETCIHANVDVASYYTPGGYDHVSTTETVKTCLDCNKELYRNLVSGGYQ